MRALGAALRAADRALGLPGRARRARCSASTPSAASSSQRLRPRDLRCAAIDRPVLARAPRRGPQAGRRTRSARSATPRRSAVVRRPGAALRRALHRRQAPAAAHRGLRAGAAALRPPAPLVLARRLPRRVGGRAPARRDRAHRRARRLPGGLARPRRAAASSSPRPTSSCCRACASSSARCSSRAWPAGCRRSPSTPTGPAEIVHARPHRLARRARRRRRARPARVEAVNDPAERARRGARASRTSARASPGRRSPSESPRSIPRPSKPVETAHARRLHGPPDPPHLARRVSALGAGVTLQVLSHRVATVSPEGLFRPFPLVNWNRSGEKLVPGDQLGRPPSRASCCGSTGHGSSGRPGSGSPWWVGSSAPGSAPLSLVRGSRRSTRRAASRPCATSSPSPASTRSSSSSIVADMVIKPFA